MSVPCKGQSHDRGTSFQISTEERKNMSRQISLRQYRNGDLAVLAGLLAISQILISLAATKWFPGELYVISPVAVVTAVVMMRWGLWAAIHAVLGGVLHVLLTGGGWQHYIIYGVGNLAALAALLFFRIFGKERVRTGGFLSVVFALTVQLLMLLCRAALALALGYGLTASLGFITTDLLSTLFTGVAIWAVRRADGVFEDQKHYLLRIQEEK